MREQVALVTGSTDGIGYETARRLAERGWRVFVHGRSADRCRRAAKQIATSTGNPSVEWAQGDFSSLEEVRRLARDLLARLDHLDVLLNNAGIYMNERRLSVDGYEMTFAVNHLAPFLLTVLLCDLVRKSAPARVITVSSAVHLGATLDFGNLQGERKFSGYAAYSLSKLGNILVARELAERLRGTRVTSNSLHPGTVNTKLLRMGFGGMGGQPPGEGAATSVELATSPRFEALTGAYLAGGKEASPSPLTLEKRVRERFWSVSETLCGVAG